MAAGRRQASRRRPPASSAQPLPGWVWGLAGLAAGGLISAVIFVDELRPGSASRSAETGSGSEQASSRESAPVRPRFDFYTLLPELEVVVPEAPPAQAPPPGEPPPPPAPVERPGTYFLQVGSFRQFEEADRMRASLAMLGVSASIERVSVNADTWHRVRVGPFSDLAELNRVRDRLHANRIDTLMVRLTGDG